MSEFPAAGYLGTAVSVDEGAEIDAPARRHSAAGRRSISRVSTLFSIKVA